MDCYKLVYKSSKTQTPYQNYINKLRQKQQQQKKRYIYGRILKFQQSRYPRQLLQLLQAQINPFQLSLQKLKEFMAAKYPDYSTDIVNQSVEFIFYRKYQQSEIIKQSITVVQDGSQFIRNGRKLMKEDFKYQYNIFDKKNQKFSSPPPSTERQGRYNDITPFSINTDRSNQPTSLKQKQKPFSKAAEVAIINQKFNNLIAEQIKGQRKQFQNIELVYQNDPNDLIHLPNRQKKQRNMRQQHGGATGRSNLTGRSYPNGGATGRSQNESFKFKQQDIIHNADGGIDTSRSDLQQLQLLLSVGLVRQEEKMQTSRSRKTNLPLKLNRQNLQNLYSADGSLKLGVVKKVLSKMKRQI